MKPQQKRTFARILPFGLISLIFSVIYLLIEKGILGDSQFYPSTGNLYNFKWNLIITAPASFLFGIFMGAGEILYFSKKFKKRSFFYKIFIKTFIYIISMIVFLLGISIANNMIDLDVRISDPLLWLNIRNFFFNWAFWSIEIYITSLIIVSLLYSEFTNYLGDEVVKNFFTGKYYKPIEEERIFMFLDMKSSTTIAEKLGHDVYFGMLREYYEDLSDPIVEKQGMIYQYVGDEIVVTWKVSDNISPDVCVDCFNIMKEGMAKKAGEYLEKYGLVPTFKAGIHCGKVTTGEIGKIKKDITFTGDVLNTAARIQGLCNAYETDLLLSIDIYEQLSDGRKREFYSIGELELKGKDEKVKVYARK